MNIIKILAQNDQIIWMTQDHMYVEPIWKIFTLVLGSNGVVAMDGILAALIVAT